MARAKVHHVKKARKANKSLGIKKGQEYWWWKFRYGGKQISFENPGVSYQVRLTEYEQSVLDFRNRIEELSKLPNIQDKETLVEDIEAYRDELQNRLDNVPDSLQENHILNERIEEVEEILQGAEDLEADEDEEE